MSCLVSSVTNIPHLCEYRKATALACFEAWRRCSKWRAFLAIKSCLTSSRRPWTWYAKSEVGKPANISFVLLLDCYTKGFLLLIWLLRSIQAGFCDGPTSTSQIENLALTKTVLLTAEAGDTKYYRLDDFKALAWLCCKVSFLFVQDFPAK